MTLDEKKLEKDENAAAEASPKPLPSEDKILNSLKPEPTIMKKSKHKKILKFQKPRVTKHQGLKGKLKKLAGNQGSSNNEKEVEEQDSRGKNVQKKYLREKDQQKKQDSSERNEQKILISNNQQNKRNKEKVAELDKGHMNGKEKETSGEVEKSIGNKNNNESPLNDKKLGGLIFMCSAKTKPDCFHYRVMGVPMSQRDLVLRVKPGLKLFLYDFDLKLMHGVYKASSSGGMKLEPTAFGGAFPVQVRFHVLEDCYPLPESVFRKALEENYNTRHKFKTELNDQQVRKLTKLFRPAKIPLTEPPVRSPPRQKIRDRDAYEGTKESLSRSHRDVYVNSDARSYPPVLPHEREQRIVHRDVPSHAGIPRNSFLSEKEYRTYGLRRERDNLTPSRPVAPALELHQRDHNREQLEYQTYGFRGERDNLTPSRLVAPALEPHQRDHEREQIPRHPATIFVDSATAPGESVRHDPRFLKEEEYRVYGLDVKQAIPSPVPLAATAAFSTLGSSRSDPYYTLERRELASTVPPATSLAPPGRYPYYAYEYGASSVDSYLPPPKREEIDSRSYSLSGRRETYLKESTDPRGRETDEAGRYALYASDPALDLNLRHHIPGPRSETVLVPVPVSARYSFAGPSTYR